MTRKRHTHLMPDIRSALATELRATRAAHGDSLPTPLVEQFAAQYGISVRTVHRLAADPDAQQSPRTKFVPSDLHKARRVTAPSLRKAWEDSVADGTCRVGYPQWTKAFKAMPAGEKRGYADGLSAMATAQPYLLRESDARNDMWIIDHYEVPVWVRHPKFRHPIKPWQTTLLDDKHRAVMGVVWWAKPPTAEQVAAAVAAAVHGFALPDGEFVGGRPRVLLMDQGGEMIGEVAAAAYMSMGAHPEPAPSRSPWVKGKLEVFHGDTLDPAYAEFPGWTGGPTDTAGRQIVTTPADQLLTFEEFEERGWSVIARYNLAHAHSALDGNAPLESWLADPAPLRTVDDAVLRQHWLTEQRVVEGRGVMLHKAYYQDNGLLGDDIGRKLQLRYIPGDRSFVDVQLSSGDWTRAVPHPLPPSMAAALIAHRAAQIRQVKSVYRQARQLAADTHAAARAAAQPPQVTPPPATGETHATPSPGTAPQAADALTAPAGTAPPPAPSPHALPANGAAYAPPPGRRRSTNRAGGSPAAAPTDASPAPAPPQAAGPAHIRPRRTGRHDPDSTP